jgi:hypothetical protein
VKRNLKLLYLLTLGALCLYVTTGSAVAVPIPTGPISSTEASLITAEGILNASVGPYFSPSSGTTVDLDLNVSCQAGGGDCQATVDFDFNVSGPGRLTFELGGTSDDPDATGGLLFPVSAPLPDLILTLFRPVLNPTWEVDEGGQLEMTPTPFSVYVPGADRYYGQFTINLAEGRSLFMAPRSLDVTFSAVPEPGSALLLGAGIAFVAFLRRKIRR